VFKYKKTFEELVNENKEELLKDKQTLDKIEKRIEKRHEIRRLASHR
jgi:Fur-regulated basic protein B